MSRRIHHRLYCWILTRTAHRIILLVGRSVDLCPTARPFYFRLNEWNHFTPVFAEDSSSMWRNVCTCVGLVLFVIVIIIIIRTATFTVRLDPVRSCRLTDDDFIRVTDDVLTRFQEVLRFKTISTNQHQYDTVELQKMVDFVHSGVCCCFKSTAHSSWKKWIIHHCD